MILKKANLHNIAIGSSKKIKVKTFYTFKVYHSKIKPTTRIGKLKQLHYHYDKEQDCYILITAMYYNKEFLICVYSLISLSKLDYRVLVMFPVKECKITKQIIRIKNRGERKAKKDFKAVMKYKE